MAKYYNGMLREDEIYKWIISDEGKKAIKYQDNPLQFAEELKKVQHIIGILLKLP
jgi:hypothetical protein